MDKHQQYVNDKTMEAYGKYLRGEYFEKARAIIVKDGLVAYIKDLVTNNITIPGGGVDNGETLEQACKREALEESGFEVKPLIQVASNEYEVKMEIGSVDFISKRIEYFYICDYIADKSKASLGLDGEYEGKVEVFFDKADKLKDYSRISDEGITKVKEYIEQSNCYSI